MIAANKAELSKHEHFNFHSVEELRQRIADLGLDLEASDDLSPLLEPVKAGKLTLPNRFVVLPMEGCDGKPDGSPDTLTLRRYRRFAGGGAGLLWVEATAIMQESRANPRQIWLHEGSKAGFAELVKQTHQAAREVFGPNHRPLVIVQLTHSGRYSRPGRKPAPIIAHRSRFLDPLHKLPPDYPLITDDELERLEDVYVSAARCAYEAGFDGVDIKACHRYLISELHASFTRENSRYGGASFENRSRFFRNIVRKVRAAVPGLIVTSRMNAFDAMAYPYGFGMSRENPDQADLTEPIELVRFLKEQGAPVVNITIGNPYYNPNINRPFDQPTAGASLPAEHPLAGVARFVHIVREIQTAVPDLPVIGGGYSWLRQFFPNVGAANVRKGWVSLVGMGRMAFAYPDCVRDLMTTGKVRPQKACIACSSCTQIMRDGGRSGCVPRDAAVYAPIYKAGRADAQDTIIELAKTCRQCNEPTCIEGCPAHVNVPKFVGQIAAGQFREAYETLRESNVLTTICGYVCPSEVQCEGACINQHFDGAVPIRHLQRWVSRKALDEGWAAEPRIIRKLSGKKVAVIGAGPAGISAASTLALLGHAVTLFEKAEVKGGAAQSVIPADRLPEAMLQCEVEAVLASLGGMVQHRRQPLNAEFTINHLLAEEFDAVLITAGLSESDRLTSQKRPSCGVIGALEFLASAKPGKQIKGKVLVIGGGNTAIDAALAAQQAGAADVAIVYRRSFAEMPAWPEERDQAIRAGIHFLNLTAPVGFVADAQGRLTGLQVIRTQLGAPDATGRRRPEPLQGTEHIIPADLVIEALGQTLSKELQAALAGIKLTEDGRIWVQPERLETSRSGIFAAGDIVNGGTTVVRAVAEGARAARQIDQFLYGRSGDSLSP